MHAVVPYSSQQAGGAQSRTIPYRSRRFGIGSSLGYAAFEWLGSTWGLRGWSQQPPGITPMPATQPLSKRPLTRKNTSETLRPAFQIFRRRASTVYFAVISSNIYRVIKRFWSLSAIHLSSAVEPI